MRLGFGEHRRRAVLIREKGARPSDSIRRPRAIGPNRAVASPSGRALSRLGYGAGRAGNKQFWTMGYFLSWATNTLKKGTQFYPFQKHFFIDFCIVLIL